MTVAVRVVPLRSIQREGIDLGCACGWLSYPSAIAVTMLGRIEGEILTGVGMAVAVAVHTTEASTVEFPRSKGSIALES